VLLETDTQFGVTRDLIGHYVLHENEPAPAADVKGSWYSLEYTYVLERGEAWLPTPPVSAKARATETAR
jgi:catechol 1,2-dioxygenase